MAYEYSQTFKTLNNKIAKAKNEEDLEKLEREVKNTEVSSLENKWLKSNLEKKLIQLCWKPWEKRKKGRKYVDMDLFYKQYNYNPIPN